MFSTNYIRPIRNHFYLFQRRLCKRIQYCILLSGIILLYILLKRTDRNSLSDWLPARFKDHEFKFARKRTNTSSGINNDYGASMCPLCFGTDLCIPLAEGAITFSNRDLALIENDSATWVEGIMSGNTQVEIGSVDSNAWKQFSNFLCRSKGYKIACDIIDVTDTYVNPLDRQEFVNSMNLRALHKLFDKMRSDFPFLICATDKFVKQLKKGFDDNGNGKLDSDEQLVMLASIVLKPEHFIMKFAKSTGSSLPIPNILGSCGQVVVRETNWTLLSYFLNESFEVRAGIAIQVLQTIEDLQGEDSEWFFLNTEFAVDKIAINKDGEVILTDLTNVAVVDKSIFLPNVPNFLDSEKKACNDLCFRKFTEEILLAHDTSGICSQMKFYGQLMFAVVCKQLFSDLKEHKMADSLNGQMLQKSPVYPGLLHSIPPKDKETIEELLKECVEESSFGGRIHAVQELREVLEKYLNYPDLDEDDTQEHLKNDSNYEYNNK